PCYSSAIAERRLFVLSRASLRRSARRKTTKRPPSARDERPWCHPNLLSCMPNETARKAFGSCNGEQPLPAKPTRRCFRLWKLLDPISAQCPTRRLTPAPALCSVNASPYFIPSSLFSLLYSLLPICQYL